MYTDVSNQAYTTKPKAAWCRGKKRATQSFKLQARYEDNKKFYDKEPRVSIEKNVNY